jgi:hypothetical protein
LFDGYIFDDGLIRDDFYELFDTDDDWVVDDNLVFVIDYLLLLLFISWLLIDYLLKMLKGDDEVVVELLLLDIYILFVFYIVNRL